MKRLDKAKRIVGGHAAFKSPLDRPLDWTEFPNMWANSKTQNRHSLRELAQRISSTKAATKSKLPWLKLATFGNDKTRPGSFRFNSNLTAINGVELDYDDGDLTWDHAICRLYEARLVALMYTTRRHTAERPRFRVLLPTSEPLPPSERAELVARAYGVLRGTVDGASFTLSQSFYYGSAAGGPVWIELVDPPGGQFVDEAVDLMAGALNRKGEPWIAAPIQFDNDDDDDDDDDDFDDFDHGPDSERIRSSLANIPSDERETWLCVGQALHHEFDGSDDGYDLWDQWSQSSHKYDSSNQEYTWRSFGSFEGAPVTIASVYRLANLTKPTPSRGLTLETPAQCSAAPLRGYILKHMIAPGDIVSIFGPPGAGKSTIAPHIGYMIARGERAFGLRTKRGVVLYVAAEDATGLKQRVSALLHRHGDAPDFLAVSGVSDLFIEGSADLHALMKHIEGLLPVLIIIDTLAMAFPGLEENDAKSMSRVVTVARQLAAYGAGVVLIHHDTKAQGSTPRGHSVLNGALDMAMHLQRAEDGIIRGKLTKNRNGSPDRNIVFRIGTEELDVDIDGDAVTAPLAEELTGAEASRKKRLSRPQSEALAILQDLEGDGPVTNEKWSKVCNVGSRVSQSENPRSRSRAFNRARNDLLELELIIFNDDGQVRSASILKDEKIFLCDEN